MTKPKISDLVLSEGQVDHLGVKSGQIAPNLFMVGDPNRAYLVAQRFDRIDHEIKNREFVTLTGTFEQLPVSVIGTGIGTDNVEIALVEAYLAYEFDLDKGIRRPGLPPMKVIRIGTSGGIQRSVKPGLMAITSYAVGLDSTGLYYDHDTDDPNCALLENQATKLLESQMSQESRFRGKIFPYCSKADPKINRALAEGAEARNLSHEQGITISSPGFYGPSSRSIEGLTNTIPDIKGALSELRLGDQRAINMEMESSLLYHLANKLGYAAGTVCPIISNPDQNTDIINYAALINQAIDLALETMTSLKN